MTQAYWAPRAWLPTGITDRVRITVANGRIGTVTIDTSPEAGDERLAGLTLPGLANGHSHAFHRALRGRTHGAGGTFWTWRKQMYRLAATLDPDSYRRLATAVYAEMALSGYTVVGEFHYLHHDQQGRPYADPNAMGAALIDAAAESGIRLTLIDVCYLSGGLEAQGHLPLDQVQQRFGDRDGRAWADRWSRLRGDATTRIGAGIHSVRAVPAAESAVVAEAARDHPLHVHLSEQEAENAATQGFYGCTPTALLDRAGVLGPHTTAVHATHLTDADIKLLGASGTTCCICPTTERDLADGIGPTAALFDAGSALSLGSDQHAVLDPFEELRGLELHERLRTGRRGHFTPDQLLAAASQAGHASLGWPEGGTIAPGALADLVTVRTDTVRTVGSRSEQILYSAAAADVDDVIVGGRRIVGAGVHRSGSVAGLLSAALDWVGDA
jgi:formiminoglutamate deiminase